MVILLAVAVVFFAQRLRFFAKKASNTEKIYALSSRCLYARGLLTQVLGHARFYRRCGPGDQQGDEEDQETDELIIADPVNLFVSVTQYAVSQVW